MFGRKKKDVTGEQPTVAAAPGGGKDAVLRYLDRKKVDIVTTPTDDIRSYHINSDKVKRVLGYAPRHTIEDAVRELARAFVANKIPNSMEDDRYYNVRLLKRLKAA